MKRFEQLQFVATGRTPTCPKGQPNHLTLEIGQGFHGTVGAFQAEIHGGGPAFGAVNSKCVAGASGVGDARFTGRDGTEEKKKHRQRQHGESGHGGSLG
jgi:hypothetical protein